MTLNEFTGRDTETRTTREATIVQYIGHVHVLAKRLQLCLPPCVTYDDLVGAGTIGLIQAVDRFQPARGLQFGTYARHRIRAQCSTSCARKSIDARGCQSDTEGARCPLKKTSPARVPARSSRTRIFVAVSHADPFECVHSVLASGSAW